MGPALINEETNLLGFKTTVKISLALLADFFIGFFFDFGQ